MSWVRERRRPALPLEPVDIRHVSRRSPRTWFLAGMLVGMWVGGATGIIGRAIEAALR